MLVGYARVSTGDQTHDLQRDALKEAGCERIFSDAVSGSAKVRPGLDEALRFVREGDVLVVWRLDHFGRSLKDLIHRIEELKERGVGFRSLTEGIDTTSATGRLVMHIFGALAEFERELVLERTRAGLKAARARGRMGGRPPAVTVRQVEQMSRMMRDPHTSVDEVCQLFDIGKTTLYRYVGPGGEVRKKPSR